MDNDECELNPHRRGPARKLHTMGKLKNDVTRVKQMEVSSVTEMRKVKYAEDDERLVPTPVLRIYALGEDGIVYELAGGTWMGFPICPELMVKKATQ